MILSLDCETTKLPFSLPWQPEAFLVTTHYTAESGDGRRWSDTFWFNHNSAPCDPLAEAVKGIQQLVDQASIVVGHNIKFDMHWFRHIGLDFTNVPVWCTMVGEYLLRHQKTGEESLSLRDIAIARGVTPKLDVVKAMWDEGYATEDIPPDILQEYGEGDTLTTLEIYHQQLEEMKQQGKLTLAYLEMSALKIFAEAEYNGMKIAVDKLEEFRVQYTKELEELNDYLADVLDISNPGSSEQLSCGLFGGTYSVPGRVPGKREGTTKMGKIPRSIRGIGFTPVPGTEGAKQGIYSVAQPVLMQLRAKTPQQQAVLDALEKHSRASQMLSTFVNGLQSKQLFGYIHHKLNQCITITGRLSSSEPNLQNIPRGNTAPIKQAFVSRW